MQTEKRTFSRSMSRLAVVGIVLAMAVEGGLHVRGEGSTSASFQDSAGRTRVRYADLAGRDADGRVLAAWLEASKAELRVVVEATKARFPVTVDPAFVQEGKLEGHGDPTGLTGANAGYSVSISGDTAVVGAHLDDTAGGVDAGSAYVFVRSGTVWTEQQKLVASDGAAFDWFGVRVSVSGDTAVVGAFQADMAGGVDAGSAYVFVRSGTVWTEQQKLVASDGAQFDNFGVSVSVSGDTAVVGAFQDDTAGGFAVGSAYVFVRSGAVWTERQKLLASDGAAADRFGISVSASADTIVVGAYFDDTLGGVDAGSAYVFVRSGTVWNQQQKLVPLDGAPGDNFGASVSVSGDAAVVGAYVDDTAGGSNAGSAYVFVRSGTVWTEQQKLVASDGAAFDNFGISVSVSGDTAVVGAPVDDTAGGVDAGSAYVFRAFSAADLSVAKTDGVAGVVPGGSLVYTIAVGNAGPSPVADANVADTFPGALTCSTTCSGTGGATCTPGPFGGSISDTVRIPAGQSVTYTSSCSVSPSATGTLTNTATVTATPAFTDPNLANNSSTDVDVIISVPVVSGTKTVSGSFAELGTVAYTVTLANSGTAQGDNPGDEFSDTLPASLTLVSAMASTGTAGTAGNTVDWNGSIPTVGSVTITINATINSGTAGQIIANQGTISFDADGDGTNETNVLTDDPGVPGASDPTVFQTDSGPLGFHTVSPCRVLDTREAIGPLGGPALSTGLSRSFTIVGACGIPITAKAVSVSIAVTAPAVAGNLRMLPGGTPVPLVSAINYAAGQTRANNAVLFLNPSGQIEVLCEQASGTVHFILDVNGYFQ